jgi:hypothetical protein
MFPAVNVRPDFSAESIIFAAIKVQSAAISSSSSQPIFGIERAEFLRRGTICFSNMSSINGLIGVVSFRVMVKGTGTTAPTQEPAVADAKGSCVPPKWADAELRVDY